MDRNLKQRFLRVNALLLEELLRRAADQLRALVPGSPAFGIPIMFHTTEGVFMASIEVLDTSGALSASVGFVDVHGHATTADDVPAWASSDEAVATVAASEDGLSADISIVGPGVCLIDVSSTNDDGSTAAAQGTITVKPGDAVLGEVSFAEAAPEEEPVA